MPAYRPAAWRLDAFSGLTFWALSFLSVLIWVARLQAPRRHLAVGSGKEAQKELPLEPKIRSQPSHSVTTGLQLPPLNEQPFLDIKVQSTPGFKVAQCMAVAPLDVQ